MTYFRFLEIFLGIPLVLMAIAGLWDARHGRWLPPILSGFPFWALVLAHIFLALGYTTPWDNYLVATGVWTYKPNLVSGITLGWVPLEEYLFFVLQTLLTALWMRFLAVRISWDRDYPVHASQMRKGLAAMLVGLWILATVLLAWGGSQWRYLALILAWALPPIAIQLAFGADILWRSRWLVTLAWLVPTLYLAVADSLAIDGGTWTIAPTQSLQIYLGNVLPLEELLFFLVTNVLIVFGVFLGTAAESRERILHPRYMAWGKKPIAQPIIEQAVITEDPAADENEKNVIERL